MKKGRTLELVIASLEKALHGKENVKVVSPYKVADKTNTRHKRPREHDVVIIRRDSHHPFLIALECKDRSRPITREQVEAFCRKCQDTGIHKGAIVSTKGFANTAKEKAKFLEIECLSLEEVGAFDWLHLKELSQIESRLIKQNWGLLLETDINPKPDSFAVLDEAGNEISPQILTANVQRALQQLPDIMLKPGVHAFTIRFELKQWQILDKTTGIKHRLKHAFTSVEVEVFEQSVPLKKVRYANEESKTQIAEAAIAPIQAGSFSGDLMMINKGDGVQLLIIPRPKSR